MQKIQVETLVHADIQTVWKHWNDPQSIMGWAFASDTWECPHAENDLAIGGRFLTRMSAKDGSFGFDFAGTYTDIVEYKKINYIMDKAPEEESARECEITFTDLGDGTTKVAEVFDAEEINSIELQQAGWQSILENFKKFVESVQQ
jgi:uncharacterized protein YndB with AHSA1/START domain